MNGDGFDDIIIGAPYVDTYFHGFRTNAGEFVILGKAYWSGGISLGQLNGFEGFEILGAYAGDYSGWSVSGAGDVNGDGFDDIIIGAPDTNDYRPNAGEAYVIFGKPL